MSDDKSIDGFDEEEEIRYQRWVQRRNLEEREAKLAAHEVRKQELPEPETKNEKRPKLREEVKQIAQKDARRNIRPPKRKEKEPGWIKVIIGGMMIVIAFLAYPYVTEIQNAQNRNLEYCNSFSGGIQQGLDSNFEERCENQDSFSQMANMGVIGAFVVGIIGLVLMILGMAKKQKSHLSQCVPFIW
jgi:hypothetical protein